LQLASSGVFVEPDTYREQLVLAAMRHENYIRFLETKALTAAILAAAPNNKNANDSAGAYTEAMKALATALMPPTIKEEEQDARDLAAAMAMLGRQFSVVHPETEKKLPRRDKIKLR